MRNRTEMSLFADALRGLLNDTKVFNRREWTKLLGIRDSAISQWLSEETIPRPSNLNLIFTTIERASDAVKEPLVKFRKMADLPSMVASPRNGKRMLPTVWSYMKRPVFDELSNKLARLSPAEQEQLLEERFLGGTTGGANRATEPVAAPPLHPEQPTYEIAIAARSERMFAKASPVFIDRSTSHFNSSETRSRTGVGFIKPTFQRLSDEDPVKPIGTPLELNSLGKETSQFLLIGDAGTGKSALVKHLVHEINDKASPVSRSWGGRKPVSVELHRLPAVESSDDLWNIVSETTPGSPEKILLILDGFDEMLQERREGLVRAVADLRLSSPQIGVIITSRPTPDLRALMPITRYRLELPSESRLFALACSHVAYAAASGGWDDALLRLNTCFREKPDVFRALRTPLLLSHAASLFASAALFPNPGADLIGLCLRFLVERWDEKKEVVRSRSKWSSKNSRLLYQWLGGICYHSLLNQAVTFTLDDITHWSRTSIDKAPMDVDLKAIAEATGVLVPSGDGHWSIMHKTIREYLAATYVVESSRDATGYLTVGAGKPWIANVLRFAASMTHDASPLLSFALELGWNSRLQKMSALAGVLAENSGASEKILERSCNELVNLLEESFENWRVVNAEEESEVFPEPKWRLAARTDQSNEPQAGTHIRRTVQAIHQLRLSPVRQYLSQRLARSTNEVVRGLDESLGIEGYMEGRSFSRNEIQLFAAQIFDI